MSGQTDSLLGMLEQFGLTQDQGRVYLVLLEQGYLSALMISRKVRLARTKVYRVLDKLVEEKLVVQKLDDRGLKFGANSPRQLELILAQREHELLSMKESLPMVVGELSNLAGKAEREGSAVLYYHGVEGLKQVTYNSTQAKKGKLLIYEVGTDMSKFLDQKYSEEMRRELVKNRIYVRQLTNYKKIDPYTQVVEHTRLYWEARYVEGMKLPIKFETLIYDDVVAMYSVKKGDMFCVEIHNEDLAEMQRQVFEYIWAGARRMEAFADGGGVRVG